MKSQDAIAEQIRESGGAELLERLQSLEAYRRNSATHQRGEKFAALHVPKPGSQVDYDVVIAGGGLSLMIAPLLAQRGLKVAVFERHRAGTSHREWNASGPELQSLVENGLVDQKILEDLIISRYDHGVCRWHGRGSYPVWGVLDHAVDAGALLAHIRDLALARGVEIFDGQAVVQEAYSGGMASVRLRDSAGQERVVSARVVVDGRGAASPYAKSDLICPTVGGVLTGLREGEGPDEINPRVGDILATTDDVEDGRQHIWEAFPGRPGETTVYLFYYADATSLPTDALTDLYQRFFDRLPSYKKGDARLVRPTFGYIPGWSRLGPGPRPPAPNCVLIGDAAARQSPLTYCGFGQMLRSVGPIAQGIAHVLQQEGAAFDLDKVMPDAAIHAGTGALSWMMAGPSRAPAKAPALNFLLDAAFGRLHEMGNPAYAALLKDEMDLDSFIDFLRGVAQRHPRIYGEVFSSLGLHRSSRWAYQLVRAKIAQRRLRGAGSQRVDGVRGA